MTAEERRRRMRYGWLLGTASLLLAGASPAGAMVVAQRDFPQLVARAEQIVVGTVTAIDTEADQSGTPYTLVTLSDLTVLKGNVGQTTTLRLYGGRVGNVVVHVPDMPIFTLGERDIVFVAGNGHDVCPLVGVWQGRFRVRYDAAAGTNVVEDNNGRLLTGLAGHRLLRAPLAVNPQSPGPMTLDAFRQAIANELAHPSATPEP